MFLESSRMGWDGGTNGRSHRKQLVDEREWFFEIAEFQRDWKEGALFLSAVFSVR